MRLQSCFCGCGREAGTAPDLLSGLQEVISGLFANETQLLGETDPPPALLGMVDSR